MNEIIEVRVEKLPSISFESQKSPVLSVLCITFNHENYIAEALDSCLKQETDFPFEIVIGEDCSSDKTRAIVEDYASRFPGLIRMIASTENVGVTENFRRTLKSCRGKYIAICEGDDYWTDSRKIQLQVDFLEGNPEYIIAYHDAIPFGKRGVSNAMQLPSRYQCDASMRSLVGARPISTLTACFRNVLTDIPREFDQAPILDLCLWSLLGSYGKGKYLPVITPAAYRMHDGGIMSSQNEATRRRMTMQTYLCLAKYYAANGHEKTSCEFILKTAKLASVQLQLALNIRLLVYVAARLLIAPFELLAKRIATALTDHLRK